MFAAKLQASVMARKLGLAEMASKLAMQAERVRENFETAFWCDDLATYALALDGTKRPCRIPASNAGHALFSGIAKPDRASKVAASLTGPDAFSGWGIRTLSSDSLDTILCPITMARSGLTTMHSLPWALRGMD